MKKVRYFNKIIKKIYSEKICDSIVLIGSALESENPQDIDIMLYRKNSIYEPKDFLNIVEIMEEIEEDYNHITCSFSSGEGRKNNVEHILSLNPIDIGDLKDMPIFFYGLKLNSNFKVIKGNKKPFKSLERPSKEEFKSYLQREYEFLMKNKKYYDCLKSILRISLLYHDISVSKDKLIEEFEKNYRYKIPFNLKQFLYNPEYNEERLKEDIERLYNFLIREIFNVNLSEKEMDKSYKLIIDLTHELREEWANDTSFEKIKNKILSYQKKYEEILR